VQNIFLYGVCFALIFSSCSKPTIESDNRIRSIAYIKAEYDDFFSVPLRTSLVIRGTVTSSDQYGNFYKTLVVEDYSGGIELKISHNGLYELYPVGCVVEVALTKLWIGAYGWTKALGTAPSAEEPNLGDIAYSDLPTTIRVLALESDYSPVQRSIGGLTGRDNQRRVQLDSVQFIAEEVGMSWADADVTTTFRHLIDACGDTLRVATYRFADYATTKIPSGSGSIDGILYYRNGRFELHPISSKQAVMTNPRF
jgi:hypothetical protein